jgi:hypothetical protein
MNQDVFEERKNQSHIINTPQVLPAVSLNE